MQGKIVSNFRCLIASAVMTLLLTFAGGCAMRGPAQAVSPLIAGLSAVLEDVVSPYVKEDVEHIAWQTFWVVHWNPVTGAEGYEIAYLTSEGRSRKTKALDAPPFRLEVAVGDNPKSSGLLAREIQLQTIQSLLAVQLTPRFAGDVIGTPSPTLQVGRPYP